MTKIIDAFEYNHVFHPWLCKNIAIESRQRVHTKSDVTRWIVQDAVTADSGIDNADFLFAALPEKPLCQNVGPPVIRVYCRHSAIGNRIAERNQCARRLHTHVDAGQKYP